LKGLALNLSRRPRRVNEKTAVSFCYSTSYGRRRGAWLFFGDVTVGILRREIDRIDAEYADDDEYDEATDDAVDAATRLFTEPSDEELVGLSLFPLVLCHSLIFG
jgi:hypothetical protein